MRISKSFWVGVATGIGLCVLVLGSWTAYAAWRVHSMQDERAHAYEKRHAPILKAPDVPAKPPAAENRPKLEDWELVDGDGALTLPADDGTVRVVSYWATWCAPCQAELPSLSSLHDSLERQHGENVDLFLYTTETQEQLNDYWPEQRESAHLRSLPIFRAEDGIPAALWAPGPPTLSIIDCEGRVAFFHRGAADWDQPEFASFVGEIVDECRT